LSFQSIAAKFLLFGIFIENKILMSFRSYTIAILSLFVIIFACTGCQKGCKVCDYGTSCKNGYCFCPNGKEGDSCNYYSYLKYVNRNFIANDPCSNYGNGYSVYITVDQNSVNGNVLYINNLFGATVEADIYSNANKQGVDLVIPDNPNNTQGAFSVSGSGIYQIVNGNKGKITLNVDYLQGGLDKQCTVILYEQ
jgi:hypothetical protein